MGMACLSGVWALHSHHAPHVSSSSSAFLPLPTRTTTKRAIAVYGSISGRRGRATCFKEKSVMELQMALPSAAHELTSSFRRTAIITAQLFLDELVLRPSADTALGLDGTAASQCVKYFPLADLDPAVASVLISVLGPVFTSLNFLFIIRIVMSWYPQLPVDKFPYVIAFAPTEPVLEPTRKLVPPVGGVDVSPVIWVALMSFFNEVLLGQQGLLVLLSQQQG